jgi:hypothetical protein
MMKNVSVLPAFWRRLARNTVVQSLTVYTVVIIILISPTLGLCIVVGPP